MSVPEEIVSVADKLKPQEEVSVARHSKKRLYINNGASIHILFIPELFGGLIQLDWVIKIQAGGKPVHLSQIRSLQKALRHLPLSVNDYHYNEMQSQACYYL